MTELIIPSRRGFIGGLLGLIAAPAIVRIESIMPVHSLQPTLLSTMLFDLRQEAMAGLVDWWGKRFSITFFNEVCYSEGIETATQFD